MSELYDSVDYNNSKFEYVGPTQSIRFYENMDFKELSNTIKNNQIKSSWVKNKQNESLNKLSNIKIDKKTDEQNKFINFKKFLINFDDLNKFYNSREEVIFLETILKCYLMLITSQNKIKLKEQDLKY